ncbi:MAG TPA: hypothetical protein VGJ70_12920, partial [Solirubrobacteraceae bacterium]
MRGARGGPVVCGPFLGEPGYETLYWIPFVRTVVEPLLADGHEVVVVSRGGSDPLYGELAGAGARYIDVIDVLGVEGFLRVERERLTDALRKNQKVASRFERDILRHAVLPHEQPLLPADMFAMLKAYPYASVCSWSLGRPPCASDEVEDRTLLKFWFGGQMPASDENLGRLEQVIERLAAEGPVAAIVNPYSLETRASVDQPFEKLVERLGIPTVSPRSHRTNLGDQIEMIARSRRFACTYGGLAYISLYTNTPTITFYSDPRIVFSDHFSHL